MKQQLIGWIGSFIVGLLTVAVAWGAMGARVENLEGRVLTLEERYNEDIIDIKEKIGKILGILEGRIDGY